MTMTTTIDIAATPVSPVHADLGWTVRVLRGTPSLAPFGDDAVSWSGFSSHHAENRIDAECLVQQLATTAREAGHAVRVRPLAA